MNICRAVAIFFVLTIQANNIKSQNIPQWKPKNNRLATIWSSGLSPENVLNEYPRPQMIRDNWHNLNGLWEYAITPTQEIFPGKYDGEILVPFPIESSLSGVMKPLTPSQNLWYRKTFVWRPTGGAGHLLLHFGAVDWRAEVYVNGKRVGSHTGGYTAFAFDISSAVKDGDNELIVKVFDPSDFGNGPHGKQVLSPENIYYTASSGIWQTVWLETVPDKYIKSLSVTPDVDRGNVAVKVIASSDCEVELIVSVAGEMIKRAKGKVNEPVFLHINNAKLWSPESPFLYDLKVTLRSGGREVDKVTSYFGLRKVDVQTDDNGIARIFINNKPYFNLGVLDQGFWPDGLYTAPTDSALKFDIEVTKAMGFNTIRKHIKIEPARWYYYADKLGVLVWQDFVNPNQGLPDGAKDQFEQGVRETIEQLYNSPAIITWVVFNERWGAYDQSRVTQMVKRADPSRLANGHSGEMLFVNGQLRDTASSPWMDSDLADVHSYPDPRMPEIMKNKASVLGEFGGIAVPVEGHLWDDLSTGWGYDGLGTEKELRRKYQKIIDTLVLLQKKGLSATIYTQPFDVESEQNGLLTYDRKVIKIPFDTIRTLNAKLHRAKSNISYTNVESKVALIDSIQQSLAEQKIQFINGNRSPDFLRLLSLKAYSNGDSIFGSELSRIYFQRLDRPLDGNDFRYLMKVTSDVSDTGYQLIKQNRNLVNSCLGANTAELFLMDILFRSKISPYLNKNPVEWEQMRADLVQSFGALADERINIEEMIFYYKNENWKMYGACYKKHFENFLITGRNNLHVNNMTWPIFEHVNDKEILTVASRVMEYNVSRHDQANPDALDTYANILYKLGKKEEALTWESKAVKISDNPAIVENYRKMKDDVPTWK